MKWIIVLAGFALITYSCKPIYRCGQPKPEEKLLVTKRVQAVINERDGLCKTLELRNNEIIKLNSNISELNSDIRNLNNSFFVQLKSI